jgi:peptidoglycan-associated lipoprotein
MSSKNRNRFLVVCVIAFLAVAGCAKKHKPDADSDSSKTVSRENIQDKDMSFDPTGSDSGSIEGLYTVHFDYDKSNLTEESRNQLVKDANWLKHHLEKSMQIEGHCDRHGSIEYNLALGERRAKTVQTYLNNLGIPNNRLSTISYGKEKLLDSSETDQADFKNRRANFKPSESPAVKKMSQL